MQPRYGLFPVFANYIYSIIINTPGILNFTGCRFAGVFTRFACSDLISFGYSIVNLHTFMARKKPSVPTGHLIKNKGSGDILKQSLFPVVMKTTLTNFLFLVSLFISMDSCTVSGKKKEGKEPAAPVAFIEGYIVRPSTVDETILISGTLKPFEETVLMPEVSGRVAGLNLPEGQFVKKGTVLVKIFDGELQAQLKKAQTQLEIAQQTLSRQTELIKVDGISQVEYDQTRLQVNSIRDDIELLKVQISKTEILAPYDGVIGLRSISMGAQITPASPVATIRESDKLKLDFAVPGKYSQLIHTGTKVRFSVEGDEKLYDAEVMATEEGIDMNTRNLKARAIVKANNAVLVPGAYANVQLQLNEDHHALMIPTQSIILQERNKQVILCRNGKAQFIKVKTGVRKASDIMVTEGLQEGDTVVVTGVLFIKPGSELKFARIK
jgi:membrane fusion protein, multidrug efflux system